MSSVDQMWALVAAKWAELNGQIDEAGWEASSPCEGWCVKDVVEHATGWQVTGGNALGANIAEGADWETIQSAMTAALSNPENLEGTLEAFGGMPKQAVAGVLIGDLLIHSWDVARSLGLDETLPEEAVQSTLMGLQRMPEEMLRRENMFGPALVAPEGASPQEQLLAFAGRQL